MTPFGGDALVAAAAAERAGDLGAAAAHLRAHLATHAGDAATRLRLGRLLLALDEPRSAREILLPLDQLGAHAHAREIEADVTARANRVLAELDERDGALTSAAIRWERALADDIDDPEARSHLRTLRPARDDGWPAAGPGHATDLSLATLVAPDGVRAARFRLIRELGRGATATVFLVRDERLDLPLALKVLHPQLAAAARVRARTRFFAEARVAARLRHPGVVAVYDVDEATGSLVMELVPGGTLRDRLRAVASDEAGCVDAREVLSTATSLLSALAFVHGAGVVHGDLKPSNLLLRRPGEVVLADFGAAALGAPAPPASAGRVLPDDERPQGTPLYLAPEQFHGAPASPRTDLFAVGAILWELSSGHAARRHGDLIHGAAVHADPIPLSRLTPLGPAAAPLRSLVDSLMSADPALRPASAADALATLS